MDKASRGRDRHTRFPSSVELRDLNVVLTVAESTSFRDAAQTLGVNPAAVSRRVRDLEDKLGASLFERSSGGVRVTGAGRAFLDTISDIAARLDEAARTIAGAGRARTGRVEIGITTSLSSRLLNQLMTAYRASHPEVLLSISEGSYHDHLTAITDRTRDIAFVPGTPPRGVESEVLWHDVVFAALPADDDRVASQSLPLSSLASDHFIVSSDSSGPAAHDFIIRKLSSLGFRPQVVQHRVGREALMTMVGLGFGTSLICATELRAEYKDVRFVEIEGETVAFSAIWLLKNDNPAFRRFLSLARQLAREQDFVAAVFQTPDPLP